MFSLHFEEKRKQEKNKKILIYFSEFANCLIQAY
jgi:hypothetical protein